MIGIMIMIMFAFHSLAQNTNNQIPSRKVPNEWFDDVDVAYDDDDANGDFHDQDKKNLASVILTAPSSQRKSSVSLPFKRNAMAATLPT